MKITMRQVAQDAGVSVATVSHVLNGTRYVSEETVAKVQESVARLGYVPDRLGRSLRMGQRQMIGFLAPDISNRFWASIIETVETVLSAQGYHLVIANTKETAQRELDHIRLLSAGVVDGLLLASTLEEPTPLTQVLPPDFPVVLLDRGFPQVPWDTVEITDRQALTQALGHLLRRGHRRVGCIPGLPHLSTTRERLEAYHTVMEQAGIPVPPEWIQYGDSMENSVQAPLQTLLEQQCTALVVANNVMAEEVLYWLTIWGRQKDVAVVGYFSPRSLALWQGTACAIVQPTEEMARTAAHQLLQRLDNPEIPVLHRRLASTWNTVEP